MAKPLTGSLEAIAGASASEVYGPSFAPGPRTDDGWYAIARQMRPRSRIGQVFGVTRRDLTTAATTLAQGHRRSPLQEVMKRLFDVVVAAVILAALSPLFLVLAVAIRRESSGPAIFRQSRIGRNGQMFTMYKFRTMRTHVDFSEIDPVGDRGSTLFKIHHDPRVTPRIGRILRRYSMDELPQLLNVLKGDMSLVGPRPALPAEVSQWPDELRRVLRVRPGMTGLWQVSGRSDLSWKESVRINLYYVDNHSLALDAAILVRTPGAVLSGRGAY